MPPAADAVRQSMSESFSILSTNAPLIEVIGDGPIYDRPNGLTVPDGATAIGPVDLLNAPIRRWRIDAPASVKTDVVVTHSPFGAFVTVRRCVTKQPPSRWRHLHPSRWPKLSRGLKRRTPSILALWHLFASDAQPCVWQDVNDGNGNQAQANGGDLVIVAFVSP
jgi:hypothetical protein